MSRPLVAVTAEAPLRQVFDLDEGRRVVQDPQGTEADVLMAIGSAGDLIASPDGLGRPPWRQTYEERATGVGSVDLVLSRHPIERVDRVTVDGVELSSECYRVHESQLERLDGGRWLSGSVVRVDYVAGWVFDGMLAVWSDGNPFFTGELVAAGSLIAECTTAGLTGAAEPDWTGGEGDVVADGGAEWTLRDVHRPPQVVLSVAAALTRMDYDGLLFDIEPGVSSTGEGGATTRYNNHHSAINNRARAVLRGLR